MKKMLYILFAVAFLAASAGCSPVIESNTTQTEQTPTEETNSPPSSAPIAEDIPAEQITPSATQTELASDEKESESDPDRISFEPWADYQEFLPIMDMDIGGPRTLIDLCGSTRNCAVATVENIEIVPSDRDGMQTGSGPPVQFTSVKYTVNIIQVVTGDLTIGEKIIVSQIGWKYGDIILSRPEVPTLYYDKTYLMSIKKASDGLPNTYYFGGAFESYPEIIDGKLHPHERSRFFEEGELLEKAIREVKAATYLTIPINIPIEESVDVLSQWLINYGDGFTPVRDLTSEELAEFYDFDNSEFVTAVIGMQLQNGYKVVWVKTTELSHTQQKEFRTALDTAAQAMADEASLHAKVSCEPFDSLITVIGANEDNASVHMQFEKMQTKGTL